MFYERNQDGKPVYEAEVIRKLDEVAKEIKDLRMLLFEIAKVNHQNPKTFVERIPAHLRS